MKILLLCPWLPYPANWGFAKRVYHILQVLARRHTITLLTYTDGDDAAQLEALRKLCTVHTVPRPALPFGKRLGQLASLPSPVSFQRRLMYAPAMQEALDTLSRGTPFDVIHVSTSQMACFRFDPRSIWPLADNDQPPISRQCGKGANQARQIFDCPQTCHGSDPQLPFLLAAGIGSPEVPGIVALRIHPPSPPAVDAGQVIGPKHCTGRFGVREQHLPFTGGRIPFHQGARRPYSRWRRAGW